MSAPTPYDKPEGLLERLTFPSLRNAYLEGAAADRDPGYNVAGMVTEMHELSDDLTKARQQLADAPHGETCMSMQGFREPLGPCDCWKAGL